MLRLILVDLDDTLFDRGAAFARWAERFVATRRSRFPIERRAADLAALAAIDARGRRSRREAAEEMTRRFRLDEDPRQVAARMPGQLAACVEAEDGTAEAVAVLARRAPVAVVTNGGAATQRAKLARLGLLEAVGTVVVSAEVRAAKPDSERIFQHALAWAGCAAADALMIGDDPELDLAPARALGMATLWVDRRRGDSLATAVARGR